jgi:hypothetical protein
VLFAIYGIASNQVPVVLPCPTLAVRRHVSFHAEPAVAFISAQIRPDADPPFTYITVRQTQPLESTGPQVTLNRWRNRPDPTQPGQGYIDGAHPVQVAPAACPLLPCRPHNGHLSPASKLRSNGHSVIGARCPHSNKMHRSQLADGCVHITSR